MARISEDRVDLLEEKMRAKIDTMTGFSDVEGKSRALEKVKPTKNYDPYPLHAFSRTKREALASCNKGLSHLVARMSVSVAHRIVYRTDLETQ